MKILENNLTKLAKYADKALDPNTQNDSLLNPRGTVAGTKLGISNDIKANRAAYYDSKIRQDYFSTDYD